ncbi:hypothetical protein KDL44_05350 [bacterium]|nr:hypothetical protein [bacterium]
MKHELDCQSDCIRGFDGGVAICANNPVQAQQQGQQDDPWIQQAEVADVLGGDQVPVIQHAHRHQVVKPCTPVTASVQQAATVCQHSVQSCTADEDDYKDKVLDAGIDCQPEYCGCHQRVHAFHARCMRQQAELPDKHPIKQHCQWNSQQQQSRAG